MIKLSLNDPDFQPCNFAYRSSCINLGCSMDHYILPSIIHLLHLTAVYSLSDFEGRVSCEKGMSSSVHKAGRERP